MIASIIRDVVSRLPSRAQLAREYAGKPVLVLGADGFLGSYMAATLQMLGADVGILQRRPEPLLGRDGFTIFRGDMADADVVEKAVTGREIIFDFAGTSGALESNRNPSLNLNAESEPHLKVFEQAARISPPPLLVFCSSRTVYGPPRELPVSERHRIAPQSIYAVHKLALEHYLSVLHHTQGMPFLVVRLSNAYGPFVFEQEKSYGVFSRFIDQACRGASLRLFGDGSQRRDYIYVRDVIEFFLRMTVHPECRNRTFNLGGPEAISIADAVARLLARCPTARVAHADWPEEYRAIETGDYVTELAKLRNCLGDAPGTGIDEGIEETLRLYRSKTE